MLTENNEYNDENVARKLAKKIFENYNEELVECVQNSKLVINLSLFIFFIY